MGEALDAATRTQSPETLFTVGIPVFNGKSLLRNCLQSVVNSHFPRSRFEIIVADDGSSEPETLTILSEFTELLAADPGFFRVISLGTNSGGAARPRNRILDEATGEYVFFVDSDDTIGTLTLERVAEAVSTTPVDWVALNQVAVNGRFAACEIDRPRAEVPRTRALMTLTVHKVFRRAEIERQQLRFNEALPSGQDVAFGFSYILNATGFLMLGGYDYYYLTQHTGNPNEPTHLSKRARTPAAVIEKNERIMGSMLAALATSDLPEAERRQVLAYTVLPRFLIQEGYLKAIVDAGPGPGGQALRRLSTLLAEPSIADLDPPALKGVTEEHLAVVAHSDWNGLLRLLSPAGSSGRSRRMPESIARFTGWGVRRTRRFVDVASGRVRHRRVIAELGMLRRSVEDIREAQRQLETRLRAETSRSTGRD